MYVINEKKFNLPAVLLINEKFCQPCPFIQASSSIRDLRVNLGNILNQLNNIKQINLFPWGQKAEKKTPLITLETLRPKTFDWVSPLFYKSFQRNLLRGMANYLGAWYTWSPLDNKF
jgi:hypothetical protein